MGLVVLAVEITTTANVDYIKVARDANKRIGYDNTECGIDYKCCVFVVAYDKQLPDVAQGVDGAHDDPLDQCVGEQGIMFGYDCEETPQLTPFPIWLLHSIFESKSQLRKEGRLPWLRPKMELIEIRKAVIEEIIKSTYPKSSLRVISNSF